MMLNYIIGPLIGGVIGLITNGIAIRMLFRPLKPVKIFGKTLPFTPGLIPKERGRIARSVGQMIATNLISETALSRTLLSEEMDAKLLNWMDAKLLDWQNQPVKMHVLLSDLFSKQKVIDAADAFQRRATDLIYQKVCDMHIGAIIAETAMKEIQNHPLFASFSFLMNEEMLTGIQNKIQETVDQMVEAHGEAVIGEMVEKETLNLLTMSTSDLAEKLAGYEDRIKHQVLSLYHTLVQNQLSRVLKAIDIAGLVENEINRFDLLELEKLILSLMKKELNAIIGLGGLLGLIMGALMNFF